MRWLEDLLRHWFLFPLVLWMFGACDRPMGPSVSEAVQPTMKVVASGVLGDVNNDGKVDAFDAMYVALYSADKAVVIPNAGDISLGDVNGDGKIDASDALLIALYCVNPFDESLPERIGQAVSGDTSESDTDALSADRETFEINIPPDYRPVRLKQTGDVWGIPVKFTSDSDLGVLAYMLLGLLKGCDFANAELERGSIVHVKTLSLGSLSEYESMGSCQSTSKPYSSSWGGLRVTHLRFFDEGRIQEAIYDEETSHYISEDASADFSPPKMRPVQQIVINGASPKWSPDGERIAFHSRRDRRWGVYIANADGSDVTRLSTGGSFTGSPSWSPDGQRIAFVSDRAGNYEIFSMNADGSDLVRLTDSRYADDGAPAWSPDGQRIVFRSATSNEDWNIYTMNADGTGVVQLTFGSVWDDFPDWSPDGERIAFRSDRSGTHQIYLMNTDGSGLVQLTDEAEGATSASWSPDGQRIAFVTDRDGNYELYMVNVDGSELTRLTHHSRWDGSPDWSPDGTKIVFHSDRAGRIGGSDTLDLYVMEVE